MKTDLEHPLALAALEGFDRQRPAGQIFGPSEDGGVVLHTPKAATQYLGTDLAVFGVRLDGYIDAPACQEIGFTPDGQGLSFCVQDDCAYYGPLSLLAGKLSRRDRLRLESLVSRIELILIALGNARAHPMGVMRN